MLLSPLTGKIVVGAGCVGCLFLLEHNGVYFFFCSSLLSRECLFFCSLLSRDIKAPGHVPKIHPPVRGLALLVPP